MFSGFVNLCRSPLVFIYFFIFLVAVARMDMSLLS